MKHERGKTIVLYGANNLGKTEQAWRLVEALKQRDIPVDYLKYPIYDSPTGQRINAVLREDSPMSDLELQKLFAEDRRAHEPELRQILRNGVWTVLEDYKDTGTAWGIVKGISIEKMEGINRGLLDTDLEILMDGELRFNDGIEAGHRHEGSDKVWTKARDVHRMLGNKYGWQIVNANQDMDNVHADIMRIVDPLIP